MYSGWDVFNDRSNWDSLADKTTYFSGEDDGHQVKKGWVYAVPAYDIDSKKYDDDEEVYMYFSGSGDITKDQFKKINGKYYAFSQTGVMKTGVVIWCPAGTTGDTSANPESFRYIGTIDLDYANGDDIVKKGWLQTDSDEYIRITPTGDVISSTARPNHLNTSDVIKLHLHGNDGARKTGQNNIEFNDTTYTFYSNGSGNKDSGTSAKKYYSMGFQLKASSDVRYGIYNLASYGDAFYKGPFDKQSADGKVKNSVDYFFNLEDDNYIVLTTSGAKQKGAYGAKKDADGNFWLISKDHNGSLKGIWTQEVNENKSYASFETRTARNTMPALYTGHTFTGLSTLSQLGLAVEGVNDALDSVTWTTTVYKNGTVSFKASSSAGSGLAFKADYGDKTNKWIPAGILDNANKTVTTQYIDAIAEGVDDKAFAYLVTPTNDYFLNCVWFESKYPNGTSWN
jgi:hypothetical protein